VVHAGMYKAEHTQLKRLRDMLLNNASPTNCIVYRICAKLHVSKL
jgi:hypothetical protein